MCAFDPMSTAGTASDIASLQPLRNVNEGAEGICWLMAAPSALLEAGRVYLDWKPQPKHMSGAFFTQGCARRTQLTDPTDRPTDRLTDRPDRPTDRPTDRPKPK